MGKGRGGGAKREMAGGRTKEKRVPKVKIGGGALFERGVREQRGKGGSYL